MLSTPHRGFGSKHVPSGSSSFSLLPHGGHGVPGSLTRKPFESRRLSNSPELEDLPPSVDTPSPSSNHGGLSPGAILMTPSASHAISLYTQSVSEVDGHAKSKSNATPSTPTSFPSFLSSLGDGVSKDVSELYSGITSLFGGGQR